MNTTRNSRLFKKKLLASCVTAAVTASFGSNFALAQDSVEEEVIVVGIRGSLDRAMDLKRNSSGVVDGISAEDIGKFPDSNLAESLQRITGVSIDRTNGEGFQVTVRGFGPQFNQITLNGRSLPSSQIAERNGTVTNRAFDMGNIASEGVSGIEVYKTGKANISSGGIGATINLKTRRPLDKPGFNFSVGGKLLMDETNRVGDDITPELSGFISWTDPNEMFGVSYAGSFQRRDSAQSGVTVDNYSDDVATWTGTANTILNGFNNNPHVFSSTGQVLAGLDANGNVVAGNDAVHPTLTPAQAALAETVVLGAPQYDPLSANNPNTVTNAANIVRYFHGDYERERSNHQVTFQFAPNENITATLDYTMAEQERFVNRAELSAWFGDFPNTAIQFDDAPQGVATPLYLLAEPNHNATNTPRDLNYGLQQGDVKNELESIGLNVEWQVSDELSFVFDYHDSESKSLPNSSIGSNWMNTGIGISAARAQAVDFSGDLPLTAIVFQDQFGDQTDPNNVRRGGNTVGAPDVGDLSSTVRQIYADRSSSETQQLRIDGRWEFANDASIDFGIESREFSAFTASATTAQDVLTGGWSASNPGDIPADMIQPIDFGGLLDGYSTNISPEYQSFLTAQYDGPGVFTPLTQGFIGDAFAIGRVLSDAAGLEFAPRATDSANRVIEEDIDAIYFQIDASGELGGMPLDVLAGIRYESTDVRSTTLLPTPSLQWQGNNDFLVAGGSIEDAIPVNGDASYDHLLPSLDMALSVTDDIKVRFSYGTTIARADYSNLTTGIGGVGAPQGGPTILGTNRFGTATNGNTGLLPLESDNFDLSFEYYYADASYVSVGYFDKRVTNFIGSAQVSQVLPGVFDPTNGPRAFAARDALVALGEPVTDTNLFNMVVAMSPVGNSAGCVDNGAGASCGLAFDPAAGEIPENNSDVFALPEDIELTATTSIPSNSKDAVLQGWELAVQHFFGESGFGVSANYTIVNGNVKFDVAADPSATQFALVGLSDSANLGVFYENDLFSARIVYNWRDEFLDNAAVNSNEPQFTEEFEQVDFNVSFNVTESFSVSLEGINIFEEDKRQYGRTTRQVKELQILGARYALGARYTF
ncbi:MAG: TonB-dependent receptor [Alteromonadaceae bacterium]|nr:MAG: TonB-dependent receptor [Alteromonadaceae bacterium]